MHILQKEIHRLNIKNMESNILGMRPLKSSWGRTFVLQVDIKIKLIRANHYILGKWKLQQEERTIENIYALNISVLTFIKLTLKRLNTNTTLSVTSVFCLNKYTVQCKTKRSIRTKQNLQANELKRHLQCSTPQ